MLSVPIGTALASQGCESDLSIGSLLSRAYQPVSYVLAISKVTKISRYVTWIIQAGYRSGSRKNRDLPRLVAQKAVVAAGVGEVSCRVAPFIDAGAIGLKCAGGGIKDGNVAIGLQNEAARSIELRRENVSGDISTVVDAWTI